MRCCTAEGSASASCLAVLAAPIALVRWLILRGHRWLILRGRMWLAVAAGLAVLHGEIPVQHEESLPQLNRSRAPLGVSATVVELVVSR